MTVALRFGVEKSNIVDTSNIGYVWSALCMVFRWNEEVPGVSLVPNCRNYHLRYNLNWSIAQLSSCSDSNVQQTGLAQKDIPVVVLITMALIATRDFQSFIKKDWRNCQFLHKMIWKLKLTRKWEICLRISPEKVFEACL